MARMSVKAVIGIVIAIIFIVVFVKIISAFAGSYQSPEERAIEGFDAFASEIDSIERTAFEPDTLPTDPYSRVYSLYGPKTLYVDLPVGFEISMLEDSYPKMNAVLYAIHVSTADDLASYPSTDDSLKNKEFVSNKLLYTEIKREVFKSSNYTSQKTIPAFFEPTCKGDVPAEISVNSGEYCVMRSEYSEQSLEAGGGETYDSWKYTYLVEKDPDTSCECTFRRYYERTKLEDGNCPTKFGEAFKHHFGEYIEC